MISWQPPSWLPVQSRQRYLHLSLDLPIPREQSTLDRLPLQDPQLTGPQWQPGAVFPGGAWGTPTLRCLWAVQEGMNPGPVPTPYLGQKPEGEEEHGVHGLAAGRRAECPATGQAAPPALKEPG